jgi:hypothetical protein
MDQQPEVVLMVAGCRTTIRKNINNEADRSRHILESVAAAFSVWLKML